MTQNSIHVMKLRRTNSLKASFSNDDYYKVGFAGACFREAILFLVNPYYISTTDRLNSHICYTKAIVPGVSISMLKL